jgi:hypothetical protein
MHDELAIALQALLQEAQQLSADLGPTVRRVLDEGLRKPLAPQEAEALLTHVIEGLRTAARLRGDSKTEGALGQQAAELLQRAESLRERVRATAPGPMVRAHSLHLLPEHNGIRHSPVAPTPVFHEKEVPVNGGYVRTKDIKLWSNNERLEIHVAQFRANHGRAPSPEELLNIMLGHMPMEGLGKEDEFEILDLARSIAANGLRKPPIIDVDGTLLDGNRRVAACMLILAGTDEFGSAEEKKRAEYIYVWQLTPHATDDDRQKVIVSLNFESEFKKEWPEYIKARKVAQDWEGLLALEPQRPGKERQAAMKKALSKKYALGPDTTVVNRYLKMVRWAQEFEDYHINERNRDRFTVQHATNRYFQYFDELSKGEHKPGGVGYVLNDDDRFRGIVFDLLFDGKVESWKQVRDLKHIAPNAEARELLAKAHREEDVDTAQGYLEDAITIANTKRAEARSLGANLRIEIFTKWLEEVPPRTLRDEVKPENLQNLLNALMLVKAIIEKGLDLKGVGEPGSAGQGGA